jgi:hypothetical protein
VKRLEVVQQVAFLVDVASRPQPRLLTDEVAPDDGREGLAGPRLRFSFLSGGVAAKLHPGEQLGSLGSRLLKLEERC